MTPLLFLLSLAGLVGVIRTVQKVRDDRPFGTSLYGVGIGLWAFVLLVG